MIWIFYNIVVSFERHYEQIDQYANIFSVDWSKLQSGKLQSGFCLVALFLLHKFSANASVHFLINNLMSMTNCPQVLNKSIAMIAVLRACV